MKDCELIDELGGTASVARWLQISQGAVSNWRNRGIPDSRKKTLEDELKRRLSNEKR